MARLSWQAWAFVCGVGTVVAVVVFLGLLQVQHWRQDEENLHAAILLLNYNMQEGRLLPLPQAAPPPRPPVPVPAPPVEKKP